MIDIEELRTSGEVLDFFRLSHDRWQIAQVFTSSQTWIFRGQGDSRWPLVPSSLRRAPHCSESNQSNDPAYSKYNPIRFPWRILAEETDSVRAFLRLADELGLLLFSIPEHVFKDLYKQTKAAAEGERKEHPEMNPQVQEAFALAQHHGVRTRFLDWSASPLAALYFAAKDAFDARCNSDDDRDSFAVWAVPRQLPNQERIRFVTPARSRNPFAQRQLGYLTYDNEVDLHYDQRLGWPSQDVVLDKYQQDCGNGRWPVLRKVVVPKYLACELLCLLYQEGVSQAHLMPTLDNIVETMDIMEELVPSRYQRITRILGNELKI